MPKSLFFRIASEGATVDGRVIDRRWLQEMAASYSPETYTARINCEHITGYSPEGPFNAYGSVLALRTEEFNIDINGKTEKRLGLYAEIDANENLVAINRSGQKLFASCEIHPDFAGGGTAYLVGLAVTDRPASLGVEPLKFAALSRPNLFTLPAPATIELLPDAGLVDTETVRAGLLAGLAALFKSDPRPAAPAPAPAPAPEPQPANDNIDIAGFAQLVSAQIMAAIAPATTGLAALQTEFSALKAGLDAAEQPQPFRRAPATGSKGAGSQTDC